MSTWNVSFVSILASTLFLIGFAFLLDKVYAQTDGIDATIVIGLCGDSIISGAEECEPGPPEELGGAICTSQGFDGGTLSCNSDCTFNTSQCTTDEPPPAPSGGGGGGGGGGSASTPQTSVHFSGRAYPGSVVTLLKDAQVAATTIADANANFQVSTAGLAAGNYIFSLYSEDRQGLRSSLQSFPVSVTAGVAANIGSIFIAPTLGVDKVEVSRGDVLTFFGQSAPLSEVTISINSEEEQFIKQAADIGGAYLVNFDTSVLAMGEHHAKSRAALGNEITAFGKVVGFLVGTKNVLNIGLPSLGEVSLKGDVNGDGRVNLIDFSIAAYWYKRTNPPAHIDLNSNGTVDLVDFSIMAFNWSG